ncbi:hypothetical protein GC102_35180 [Paenibacillus sp. LMG 31460]|uniref:Glycosyltransferase family 1 protein n=1 Tax=Paenibacillus germinis TaxID=2654979 RepID=A0ABX1ZGC1_9BACL|nr:hypothetical protein [Paenibacillus germinis]NOU90931.1 hypothetical protein [Paenibacillus germinis]
MWPALQQFSREVGDSTDFYFWGYDPSSQPPLSSPTHYIPVVLPYSRYLNKFREMRFDAVLSPLFDQHRIQQAKSPIKYLDITAMGSIGIYSDVKVYQCVRNHVTGILAANHEKDWLRQIRGVFKMDYNERKAIWEAACLQVRTEFTAESQAVDIDRIVLAATL